MNEPDARLRNMLVAAHFIPVGILPTETSEGDVVYWDTWLSLTFLPRLFIFHVLSLFNQGFNSRNSFSERTLLVRFFKGLFYFLPLG